MPALLHYHRFSRLHRLGHYNRRQSITTKLVTTKVDHAKRNRSMLVTVPTLAKFGFVCANPIIRAGVPISTR